MGERCNMLWIGPFLGRIERACINSVLRQGNPITLWCYKAPANVPGGVELADASEILPETAIIRDQAGSVALFANWFRYELQRLEKGVWLDVDIYLLKPLPEREYLLAWEPPLPAPAGRVRALVRSLRKVRTSWINNGVLRLPPDSPMLPPLLELFRQKKVPAWLPLQHKLAAYSRLILTGRTGLSKMPWGTAGPKAVTALAEKYGLADLALPPVVFQPFHWSDARWIADPQRSLQEKVTADTVGVHLWNECIKTFKEHAAPAGSFLRQLQEEGA